MNRIKSWRRPMLLGALLMATLVGVAGARPGAEVNVSATKTVSICFHDCIPRDEEQAYWRGPTSMTCDSTLCEFFCPVNVPYQGKYKITSFTMFAKDSGVGEANYWLYKHTPSEAGSTTLGWENTVNSSDSPQAVTGPLSHARVQPKHDVWISLGIVGTQAWVSGFQLKYRPL